MILFLSIYVLDRSFPNDNISSSLWREYILYKAMNIPIIDIGTIVESILLKLVNITDCIVSKAFGSIIVCNTEHIDLNRMLSIVPNNNALNRLYLRNTYLNNNPDNRSIPQVDTNNKGIPSNSLDETNINTVCINRNKESNPIIPGVMILLFVIVWNEKDDTEIAIPTKAATNILLLLK